MQIIGSSILFSKFLEGGTHLYFIGGLISFAAACLFVLVLYSSRPRLRFRSKWFAVFYLMGALLFIVMAWEVFLEGFLGGGFWFIPIFFSVASFVLSLFFFFWGCFSLPQRK